MCSDGLSSQGREGAVAVVFFSGGGEGCQEAEVTG